MNTLRDELHASMKASEAKYLAKLKLVGKHF
jgi:hypothetical protein